MPAAATPIRLSRRPAAPVAWSACKLHNRGGPGLGGYVPQPAYRAGDELNPPDRRVPRPRPGLTMPRRPGGHH